MGRKPAFFFGLYKKLVTVTNKLVEFIPENKSLDYYKVKEHFKEYLYKCGYTNCYEIMKLNYCEIADYI